MGAKSQKKRAHIVVRPNVIELQVDEGETIRTIIFDRNSAASQEAARKLLIKEATTLGYRVVEE
ncbi:MAG: hypothetical protein ACRDIY_04060 [Chloroflexota bacterium]